MIDSALNNLDHIIPSEEGKIDNPKSINRGMPWNKHIIDKIKCQFFISLSYLIILYKVIDDIKIIFNKNRFIFFHIEFNDTYLLKIYIYKKHPCLTNIKSDMP